MQQNIKTLKQIKIIKKLLIRTKHIKISTLI